MRKLYTLLYIGITAAAMLTGCKDDIDASGNPTPSKLDELVVDRTNNFYDITISDVSDWQATAYPRWATPMHLTGTAGEQMQIFVEAYRDDQDRRDTIQVHLADGRNVDIPICQKGLISSEINDDASPILDQDLLRYPYGTGYSVNVINDQKKMKNFKYNILNASPLSFARLLQAVQAENDTASIFFEPLYTSRSETVQGSNTNAMANQLGVNAKIEVGIAAFKLDVEAGYNQSSLSDTRNYYAMREVQHLAGSSYMRTGLIRRLLREGKDILQDDFAEQLIKIQGAKDAAARKKLYHKLIDNYGTHIVTHATLGGEMKISLQMAVTEENSKSNIHAALDLSVKVVDVKGEFDMSNSEKEASKNTTMSIRTYGGNNAIIIDPGATFEDVKDKMSDGTIMERWVKTIRDKSSLAVVDIETMPIYDFMPTQALAEELREYIVGDYQKEIYEKKDAKFIPDLYILSGYDYTSKKQGVGIAYLEGIDQEIYVERTMIPEISSTLPSTVVYSGTTGNMGYEHSFFVGSAEHKPCKITRSKSTGEITNIETFETLPAEPIKKLYIDATGEMTILPKGVASLYTNTPLKWNSFDDINLSTEGRVELKRAARLYGKIQNNIWIDDGLTVMLDGATIQWGQIICQGSATIIIADGSENTVITGANIGKGAIEGLKSEHPLIIRGGPLGNGKLTLDATLGTNSKAGISTNNSDITINGGIITVTANTAGGAGIGTDVNGKVGNITINGGTITAIGGKDAAGIGTGGSYNNVSPTCGNITINGGTVIARGGSGAAGIGGGSKCKVGNIKIKKNVVKVEATKGSGAAESIGTTNKDDCGTITIEEGANVIQK